LGRYATPRFLLQPLIENAVIHGINPEREGIAITVSASRWDNDNIIIKVTDNGKGIQCDKLMEIRRMLAEDHENNFASIGIFNVNYRIKLIFGDQYGLTIDNLWGQGVVSTITIPAKSVGELREHVQCYVG